MHQAGLINTSSIDMVWRTTLITISTCFLLGPSIHPIPLPSITFSIALSATLL
jgi:hypothetical protein